MKDLTNERPMRTSADVLELQWQHVEVGFQCYVEGPPTQCFNELTL